MDSTEPDQTAFEAVSAQTSKLSRVRCDEAVLPLIDKVANRQQRYQALLDQSTPHVLYRWIGTGVLLFLFFVRVFVAQGWYIVAYALGIYLLNLFLAFLQPKFDPSNDAMDTEMEDGGVGILPTRQDEEFRPFIRRLPEFKFWHSATRAVGISFLCSWFEIFNVPVFWPVLVMYWFMLFILTSEYCLLRAHPVT